MKSESDNVGFFEMRIRPRFVVFLLVLFVGIPWLFSLLKPAENGKTKAKILVTRTEMKTLAELWGHEHAGATGLRWSTNGALQVTLFGDEEKTRLSNCLYRTNSQGELLDFWKTPIQFERSCLTNVIIRSAGPNRRFGNKDDIVFNSVSNSFVKP